MVKEGWISVYEGEPLFHFTKDFDTLEYQIFEKKQVGGKNDMLVLCTISYSLPVKGAAKKKK